MGNVCWEKINLINSLFYIDDLVQDCSNSIANTLELLQSCTKPSICGNPYLCIKVHIYIDAGCWGNEEAVQRINWAASFVCLYGAVT